MSDLTIDSRPCQREDPFPEYMLYDIEDDGLSSTSISFPIFSAL